MIAVMVSNHTSLSSWALLLRFGSSIFRAENWTWTRRALRDGSVVTVVVGAVVYDLVWVWTWGPWPCWDTGLVTISTWDNLERHFVPRKPFTPHRAGIRSHTYTRCSTPIISISLQPAFWLFLRRTGLNLYRGQVMTTEKYIIISWQFLTDISLAVLN